MCITLDVCRVVAIKQRGCARRLVARCLAMRYGSGIIRMKAETIIGAFLSGGGGAKNLTLVVLKMLIHDSNSLHGWEYLWED